MLVLYVAGGIDQGLTGSRKRLRDYMKFCSWRAKICSHIAKKDVIIILIMIENKISSGDKQTACGVAAALEIKEIVTISAEACEI